jgi:hypothetical protein
LAIIVLLVGTVLYSFHALAAPAVRTVEG